MSQPTPDANPSFLQRIPIAFGAFFSSLSNPLYAGRVQGLREDAGIARRTSLHPRR